jgi:hypothetical protein
MKHIEIVEVVVSVTFAMVGLFKRTMMTRWPNLPCNTLNLLRRM